MSGDNRLRAGLLLHCSGIRPRHSYILQTSEGFARKDIRMLTTVEDVCQNEGIGDKTGNMFFFGCGLMFSTGRLHWRLVAAFHFAHLSLRPA